MLRLLIACGLIFGATLSVSAGDWPEFRGPNNNGIAEVQSAPTEWGAEKNIKWKAPIEGDANSSPIVAGGKVFVVAAKDRGRERTLYCFDRKDGKELWSATVEYPTVMPTHKTNPYGGSTPASDGERVVVWHGSAGLYCYDLEGDELWSRDLGEFRHIWGYGSSPIIHQGVIYLNAGPGERQFMVALELKSGEQIWKTDEPGGKSSIGENREYVGSWSTPVIANVGGEELLVCNMPTRVVGYELKTGDIRWYCAGLSNMPRGDLAYASPLVKGNLCIAMGGYQGPAIGFEMGAVGNITETHRLWRVERGNPQRIGSGVVLGDHIYMANAGPGIAQCIEARTGDVVWEERLPGGNHWGSLVLAAGNLYVTNQAGTTHVIRPSTEGLDLIASNRLDEPSNATPAFSDGEIFIRTNAHLYCIAEK